MTPTQIGTVIRSLRKEHQVSQEQLAEVLGMPRPSLSQMENGSRELSFLEFQQMLRFFHISFEEFVSHGNPVQTLQREGVKRINGKIPFFPEKMKQLLLYILQSCGGRPNIGETVIYKLLYFCDFDYFERYEKPLTGMKYKRMQYGPVPDQKLYAPVLKEMQQQNLIARVSKPYLNNTLQTRYLNFVGADLAVFGPDTENVRKVADAVIGRLSFMSARQVEEYVHEDYPWLAHKDKEEIDYSTVFQRSAEFAQRDYEQEFLDTATQDVHNSLPPMTKAEYAYYMSLPE